MACDDCGSACQGKYCSTCEQIRFNEASFGDTVEVDDEEAGT